METQSTPWQVCLLTKSLVLLTFAKLRSRREAALLFPRVVIASEGKGSRPSHPMIISNTERHPNNSKTDQLPILMSLPAFKARTISQSYSSIISVISQRQARSTGAVLLLVADPTLVGEESHWPASIPETKNGITWTMIHNKQEACYDNKGRTLRLISYF